MKSCITIEINRGSVKPAPPIEQLETIFEAQASSKTNFLSPTRYDEVAFVIRSLAVAHDEGRLSESELARVRFMLATLAMIPGKGKFWK